ncbi:hypothetical protein ACVW1A_004791 [Bradyrhizobium sp. LB1.3]
MPRGGDEHAARARKYAAKPASYADIVRSIAEATPLFDPTDGEV